MNKKVGLSVGFTVAVVPLVGGLAYLLGANRFIRLSPEVGLNPSNICHVTLLNCGATTRL